MKETGGAKLLAAKAPVYKNQVSQLPPSPSTNATGYTRPIYNETRFKGSTKYFRLDTFYRIDQKKRGE
jgi:hypothetical protein